MSKRQGKIDGGVGLTVARLGTRNHDDAIEIAARMGWSTSNVRENLALDDAEFFDGPHESGRRQGNTVCGKRSRADIDTDTVLRRCARWLRLARRQVAHRLIHRRYRFADNRLSGTQR